MISAGSPREEFFHLERIPVWAGFLPGWHVRVQGCPMRTSPTGFPRGKSSLERRSGDSEPCVFVSLRDVLYRGATSPNFVACRCTSA